jgi:thiosulfate/3-mercaptopyruvate sulfurtransferase
MKNLVNYGPFIFVLGLSVSILAPARCSLANALTGRGTASSSAEAQSSDLSPGSPQLMSPEELFNLIQSPKGEKPLILNVGPHLLYMQAHIPGAEYIGAGSDKQGIESLRRRLKAQPHNTFIVLYCGCCPWAHCPNVRPAYEELHKAGFSNVKVLYIADNFGTDWVNKGYPTIKGQ